MTYKTKSQVRAEQSQDTQSQEKRCSIPVMDGLEPSLKILYDRNRDEARSLVANVRCQAYKDEFQEAIAKLDKGMVSPDFFATLTTAYTPIATDHVPMHLLTAFGAEPKRELDSLCLRNDYLIGLEESGEISSEQLEELAEIQAKLKDADLLESNDEGKAS